MNRISLTINGNSVTGEAEPRTHLADFLRESRDLTGTHLGCEHGVCGACTLLVDGVPVRSCITFAVACDGASVTTIEGLDDDEITRALREAFRREHALQCGYCTPGMLISARDLVARGVSADENEIRIAMSGNLCRCTGYVGIIRAVRSVITERQGRRDVPAKSIPIGPAGSGHAVVSTGGAASAGARPVSQPPAAGGLTQRPPIDRAWTPQVSFEQKFVVRFPRQMVWDVFGNVRDVAACLPGVSLVGEPTPEHVDGKMRVKVGPIVAEFHGEAAIERDAGSYSGRIIGAGSDAGNSSTTRGMISYRLLPVDDGRSTEVAMTIGYTLTGMLAQFGRGGVVQDVASRLTAAFVHNLEARLDGKAPTASTQEVGLDAGSLLLSVLAGRLKALFRKAFGRS
ncbi:MAG: 2Fe-2S iron-sulfur cluster binding domain-containing protein [Bradyrhizobium sp.]|nr:2Fe-2S iron-sulfur cluster binding domain-containing protein [Bradyrhizobium sp.]